jgi:hypothetical protein
MEEYYGARQATDDNMAHVHCMLDIYDHKHTLRISNTYRIPTATTVEKKHLYIALYVVAVLFNMNYS